MDLIICLVVGIFIGFFLSLISVTKIKKELLEAIQPKKEDDDANWWKR